MSFNDHPKCVPKNETNIPVPKVSGKTKSNVQSQFPELRKYIETIISANNGCDSEDTSAKGERISKVGKSGKNRTRNENKNMEKRKFNLNLNLSSEKLNEKTKTTVSVSSRENVSNQFFSDFEDPRNWDVVTAQNNFHKNFKIDKILKSLFPNPYKMLQSSEFNKSKISMYIEKIVNKDVTFPDVIIAELESQKTVDSTRVESIFEADYDKDSNQTNLRSLNSSSSIRNQHSKTFEDGRNNSSSDDFALKTTPTFFQNFTSGRSNDLKNMQNSLENVTNDNSSQTKKKRADESCLKFGKRRAQKTKNSSSEKIMDYDIGKLKLLTVTDSDDSSKEVPKEKGKRPNYNLKNEAITNENSPIDKLMFSSNGRNESEVVKEFLNELNYKHRVNQTEARNRTNSERRERKTAAKRENSLKISTEMVNSEKTMERHMGESEEVNLAIFKPGHEEMNQKESQATQGKETKVGDGAAVDANEKINEVLQCICDHLYKCTNEDDSKSGNEVMNTNIISEIRDDKWPKLDKPPTRNLSRSKRFEVSKVSLNTPHGRKQKAPSLSRSEKKFPLSEVDRTPVHDQAVADTVYSDSTEINNENIVQTVEIQNELGGYTEELHQTQMSPRDLSSVKSILPLSLRTKKSKTNTYKVLKNALEREERLLRGAFNMNKLPPKNNLFENPIQFLTKESNASCSVVGAFKRQHSNFVICVNSLPRNVRAGNTKDFSFHPSWTISLDEIPQPTIQPLPYYESLYSEELQLDGAQLVAQTACKAEAVFVSYRTAVYFTTTTSGVLFVLRLPKVEDEILLKNSKTPIITKYKMTVKSFYVEPSAPPKTIDCTMEICQKVELDLSCNLHDQVEALEGAVEQTEVYFLEQNSNATYTMSETSTESRDERFENLERDEDSEKKNLHDLLVRTYNLQQKLHRHLKRLIHQPTSESCSLIQEKALNFGAWCRNSEMVFRAVEKTSGDATVYEYIQTPQKPTILDKVITVEVEKVDHATSYDPPSGSEFEKIDENSDNSDDDRSSIHSFKSSNDFSGGEKKVTATQSKENAKHVHFRKNIFNEIDLYKNRILSEKDTEKGMDIIKNEAGKKVKEPCEDTKTPMKFLKTVFKGKESLTELSLGLKTVPLAKISNISVEKRKISENHTKISICIAKEKAYELPQDRTTSNEMMHRRLSYFLDSMQPSLSSCHTNYSRAENEVESDDDDEDDFKSVLSTLSRPHSETNLICEAKEVKKLKTTPPKSFTKHRFDFYRKMDTSNKIRQKSMSNTSCTYKEFEPLEQALTEMQIRMRSIKRNSYFSSNDYYERALKLARMSAGYCQSCGSRSVIPQDTFGYYSTILPRNQLYRHRSRHLKATPPHSSYYSLESSVAELSDQFHNLDLRESSSYLLNSSRTIIRNSLNDVPIYSGTL